jgi:hypothetical protein
MKRIIERLDNRNLKWEGEDRAILALFVALLRTRNPAFNRDQNEVTEQFYRWPESSPRPHSPAPFIANQPSGKQIVKVVAGRTNW